MPKMKVTEKSEKLHKQASQALQESRAQLSSSGNDNRLVSASWSHKRQRQLTLDRLSSPQEEHTASR